MAFMGPPISWVAVHRLHHAYSDEPQDPRSPVQKDWWWAQMGWIIQRAKDRKQILEGTFQAPPYEWADTFDNDTPFMKKFAKDIVNDRYYRSLTFSLSFLPFLLTLYLCFLIGGWPAFLGRGVAALTTVWCTWFVNSYTHIASLGYRNFNTKDSSRNVWWVALLTQGEGWHNNHHAQPLSAQHGMKWWEFDLSWVIIRSLQRFGLAWKVHTPKVMERREEQTAA
jgi:stearoyl-CoA desaturase (delta-9 desaturase)